MSSVVATHNYSDTQMNVLTSMVEAFVPALSDAEIETVLKEESAKTGAPLSTERESAIRSWCKISALDLDIPVKLANQLHAILPSDTVSE